MAEMLPPVVATLLGDITDALDKIAEFQAALETLQGQDISVGVNTMPAEEKLAAFEGELRTLAAAEPLIEVNTLLNQAAFAQFEADLAVARANSTIDLAVDTIEALQEVALVRAAAAQGVTMPINPDLNVAAVAAAEAALGGAGGAEGGGGGLGGLLGALGWGGGKGIGGALGGMASFGSILSLMGFGAEHVAATGIGIGGSMMGAGLGAGFLGLGGAGTMGVGMLTDYAGIGQALNDYKQLSAVEDQVSTAQAQYNAAVAQFGANSTQAATALTNLQSAQVAYNATLSSFPAAAQSSIVAMSTAVQGFEAQWSALTGKAEGIGAQILTQFVQTGQKFLPTLATFATKNMTLMKQGLQPFFTWLSSKGSEGGLGIFKTLEQTFTSNLPTGLHAFEQGFELMAKTMKIAAPFLGVFIQKINHFLTELNGAKFGQWKHFVLDMIHSFKDWFPLLVSIGKLLFHLFEPAVGLGDQFAKLMTGIFSQISGWLSSIGGKKGQGILGGLFNIHEMEVIQGLGGIIQGLLPLLESFANAFIVLATGGAMVATPILKAIAWVLNEIDKSKVATTVLGIAAAFAFFGPKVISGFTAIAKFGHDFPSKFQTWLLGPLHKLGKALTDLGGPFAKMGNWLQNLGGGAAAKPLSDAEKMTAAADQMTTAATEMSGAAETMAGAADQISVAMNAAAGATMTAGTEISGVMEGIIPPATDAAAGAVASMEATVDASMVGITGATLAMGEEVNGVLEGTVPQGMAAAEGAAATMESDIATSMTDVATAATTMSADIDTAMSTTEGAAASFASDVDTSLGDVGTAASGMAAEVNTALGSTVDEALSATEGAAATMASSVDTSISDVGTAATGAAAEVQSAATEMETALSGVEAAAQTMGETVDTQMAGLQESMATAAADATASAAEIRAATAESGLSAGIGGVAEGGALAAGAAGAAGGMAGAENAAMGATAGEAAAAGGLASALGPLAIAGAVVVPIILGMRSAANQASQAFQNNANKASTTGTSMQQLRQDASNLQQQIHAVTTHIKSSGEAAGLWGQIMGANGGVLHLFGNHLAQDNATLQELHAKLAATQGQMALFHARAAALGSQFGLTAAQTQFLARQLGINLNKNLNTGQLVNFGNAVKTMGGATGIAAHMAQDAFKKVSTAATNMKITATADAKTTQVGVKNALQPLVGDLQNIGDKSTAGLIKKFLDSVGKAAAASQGIHSSIINPLEPLVPELLAAGDTAGAKLVQGLINHEGAMAHGSKALKDVTTQNLNPLVAHLKKIGDNAGAQLILALEAKSGDLTSTSRGIVQKARDGAKGVNWSENGQNYVNGIISGMQSMQGALNAEAASQAAQALASSKAAIKAKSPSQATHDEVGIPFVQGIILGIQSQAGLLRGVAQQTLLGAIPSVPSASRLGAGGVSPVGAASTGQNTPMEVTTMVQLDGQTLAQAVTRYQLRGARATTNVHGQYAGSNQSGTATGLNTNAVQR